MKIIPLLDAPSQTVSVQLAGQACRLNVYVKTTGTYLDLYVADRLIVSGVVCQNVNRIVRDAYLGFVGDFAFLDTRGKADPTSPGMGSRFLLVYLEPADLARNV